MSSNFENAHPREEMSYIVDQEDWRPKEEDEKAAMQDSSANLVNMDDKHLKMNENASAPEVPHMSYQPQTSLDTVSQSSHPFPDVKMDWEAFGYAMETINPKLMVSVTEDLKQYFPFINGSFTNPLSERINSDLHERVTMQRNRLILPKVASRKGRRLPDCSSLKYPWPTATSGTLLCPDRDLADTDSFQSGMTSKWIVTTTANSQSIEAADFATLASRAVDTSRAERTSKTRRSFPDGTLLAYPWPANSKSIVVKNFRRCSNSKYAIPLKWTPARKVSFKCFRQ